MNIRQDTAGPPVHLAPKNSPRRAVPPNPSPSTIIAPKFVEFWPPPAARALVLRGCAHYVMGWRASALLVNMRQHSSGLKQIRGGWRCRGSGHVTWLPPVHTGPRELDLYGRCGARHPVFDDRRSGKRPSGGSFSGQMKQGTRPPAGRAFCLKRRQVSLHGPCDPARHSQT